jgi:hypothetical protein
LVLREAVLLLAVGLAVGTGLAAWAGEAAASLLYGLKLRDPLTWAVALLAVVVCSQAMVPRGERPGWSLRRRCERSEGVARSDRECGEYS